MIRKIMEKDVPSGMSSPFLSLVLANSRSQTESCDGLYSAENEQGDILFVFSVKRGLVCIAFAEDFSYTQAAADELQMFFEIMHISEVISNRDARFFSTENRKCAFMQLNDNVKALSEVCQLTPASRLNEFAQCYELLSDNKGFFDEWYTELSLKLREGTAFGVYAERDGKVVSTALAPWVYSGDCFVSGVFTHPDYRGQGIATETVKALSLILKNNNIKNIFLWCEPTLVEFYNRTGFVKINEIYIGAK